MNSNIQSPYLSKQCYLYFPTEDEIIVNNLRKFFEGQITYTPQEQMQIAEFIKYSKCNLPPQLLLRMLYATKFKFDKCLQAIQAYQEWKSMSQSQNGPSIQKILHDGVVYTHGRDNRLRPIIIVNATKLSQIPDIEMTLQALTVFLEFVLQQFMLPGQIENWVVILDLGGLGLRGLPKQDLYKVMSYLSSNYRSRMHKCYVISCSRTLTLTWNMIKGFLEDVTVNKISFENGPIPLLLHQHTDKYQIEKKYGGLSENCTQFWPPIVLEHNYPLKLISEEQYRELQKNGVLKNNRICNEILNDDPPNNTNDDFQSCEEDNDDDVNENQ